MPCSTQRRAARPNASVASRPFMTLLDLIARGPDRAESHFHLGAVGRGLRRGDRGGARPRPTDEGERWRHLGRLDSGGAPRSHREHVHELMEDPMFDDAIEHPEGRVALRAVGRMLLARTAKDEQVFDYYTRHLGAVDDEGSRRDAEFLLEEAPAPCRPLRARRAATKNEVARASGRAPRPLPSPPVSSRVPPPRSIARWDACTSSASAGRMPQDCYRRALEHLPDGRPVPQRARRGSRARHPRRARHARPPAGSRIAKGREEAKQHPFRERSRRRRGPLLQRDLHARHALLRDRRPRRTAAELLRRGRCSSCGRTAPRPASSMRARASSSGHCLLHTGRRGGRARVRRGSYIQRDAGASNLDASRSRSPVFDDLREAMPDARVPGRRGGRGRRERGPSGGRRPRSRSTPAATDGGVLSVAWRRRSRSSAKRLASHGVRTSHQGAASSWTAPSRAAPTSTRGSAPTATRLDALLAALNETRRGAAHLRALPAPSSTSAARSTASSRCSTGSRRARSRTLLDDVARYHRELVDLYEVMPDRESEAFVEACIDVRDRACLDDVPTRPACSAPCALAARRKRRRAIPRRPSRRAARRRRRRRPRRRAWMRAGVSADECRLQSPHLRSCDEKVAHPPRRRRRRTAAAPPALQRTRPKRHRLRGRRGSSRAPGRRTRRSRRSRSRRRDDAAPSCCTTVRKRRPPRGGPQATGRGSRDPAPRESPGWASAGRGRTKCSRPSGTPSEIAGTLRLLRSKLVVHGRPYSLEHGPKTAPTTESHEARASAATCSRPVAPASWSRSVPGRRRAVRSESGRATAATTPTSTTGPTRTCWYLTGLRGAGGRRCCCCPGTPSIPFVMFVRKRDLAKIEVWDGARHRRGRARK